MQWHLYYNLQVPCHKIKICWKFFKSSPVAVILRYQIFCLRTLEGYFSFSSDVIVAKDTHSECDFVHAECLDTARLE